MSIPDYQKGYRAGRRRQDAEDQAQRRQRDRQAFLDRAFLAALPVAIGNNWTVPGKTGHEAHVGAAWGFALAALKQRKFA